MKGKIFIKGVHYYLAYTITDKLSSNQNTNDFFNSFKLTHFKHIFPTPIITDNDFAFTAKDETGNEITNLVNQELGEFYKQLKLAEESKKYKTDFDYQSLEKTYYSPSSAEHININYEKFNDYDYRSADKFWTHVEKNIQTSSTFNILKIT